MVKYAGTRRLERILEEDEGHRLLHLTQWEINRHLLTLDQVRAQTNPNVFVLWYTVMHAEE